MTAIYCGKRKGKRYEIMKVNSCHIPPRSLTLRSRVVSFLLAALTLHFRHFVRTVHSRAEGEARGRGGKGMNEGGMTERVA